MTTEALPEYVYELGKVEPSDALTKAINRLATAIEQATLAKLDAPSVVAVTPLTKLPPVATQSPVAPTAGCPVHSKPWKFVPAGTSPRTGKPYEAFWACPERGCDQRPPR